MFVKKEGRLGTATNFSGGIQGGISNGENIVFRLAFKPPATIGKEQQTATYDGEEGVMAAKGRHDPCVVPRAIAIVEAMAALVLADAAMAQLARDAAAPTTIFPGKRDVRIIGDEPTSADGTATAPAAKKARTD